MDTRNLWKQYIHRNSVILLLFTAGLLIGLFVRSQQLVNSAIKTQAEHHFKSIVLTRKWNALHGGVYVEMVPGVVSNPYLKDPEITAVDGRVYTKKNPALMTREISELATDSNLFTFHITSLNPLNPNNAPDEFEAAALQAFETGVAEWHTKVRSGEKRLYRYMAPLYTEEACLQCHAEQGYRVGDIRGGISVTLDITEEQRALATSNIFLFIFSAVALALLFGLANSFIKTLMHKLDLAQQEIREYAIRDPLTKIHNRRYFFNHFKDEFLRVKRHNHWMSCIMLDIDFFKKFNDAHGHQAGDAVLIQVADILKEQARATDVVSRYGGEEFVVMLPETDSIGATIFGEKVRKAIETRTLLSDDGAELKVTVSVGICALDGNEIRDIKDETVLVKYADDALYAAKRNGRNRVEQYAS